MSAPIARTTRCATQRPASGRRVRCARRSSRPIGAAADGTPGRRATVGPGASTALISWGLNAPVVVVHRAGDRRVPPIPAALVAVLWRASQLTVADPGHVAAKAGVVFQRLPRKRVMVVSDSEE